jgi:hypothetical protein
MKHPQTENKVEGAEFPKIDVKNVASEKTISFLIDSIDLKNEVGLIDMHLPPIDPHDEIGTRFDRVQRPESGVATNI